MLLIFTSVELPYAKADLSRPAFRILTSGNDGNTASPSLQLTDPEGSSPSFAQGQTLVEIENWIATNRHHFYQQAPSRELEPVLNIENATSGLFQQILDFAADIHTKSDSYYLFTVRTQFLREITRRLPGFGMVLMIQDTDFQAPRGSGARIGGALGVQFPIFGQGSLALDDHRASAVARFMPIAGYHERISLGTNPETRVHSPDTGIAVRPSAEVEAAFRFDPVRGGIRFLVQPRLTSPHDVRMVAEVYLEYGIQVNEPVLKSIHIIPRCIADFSTHTAIYSDVLAPFAPLSEASSHQYSCGISAEFVESR